jgi:Domain of unknown function (DUF4136)
MISLVFSLLFAVLQSSWPDPGKVVSTIDKKADFESVRTYAWEKGLEVFDREAHKSIVAAIDAELASRGIRLASDTQSAEVIVRYDGIGSTYVDLDELQRATKKDPNALAPTKALGSLAISMHRNKSPDRMWLGHARDFVDLKPEVREASIRKIVARVFETYPKRPTP